MATQYAAGLFGCMAIGLAKHQRRRRQPKHYGIRFNGRCQFRQMGIDKARLHPPRIDFGVKQEPAEETGVGLDGPNPERTGSLRSEEHTSELQSLMRI